MAGTYNPAEYLRNSNSGKGRVYKNRFAADPLGAAGYTFGGEAANNVDLAGIFSGIRESSFDPAAIAETAASIRVSKNMANEAARYGAIGDKIWSEAQIQIAEDKADDITGKAKSNLFMSGVKTFGNLAMGAAFLSDEDTKHTIDEIDDALDTLRKLRPVTFYYKEEYTKDPQLMHHGFIAQEYQKVMPDATYVDSFTGKLCIDTGDLIGLLVRANQQLESRITRLEVKQALATV